MKNMNNENMKRYNTTNVLETIRRNEPICRKDLAQKTGMRTSSITNIVNRLISLDLINQTIATESSGGRKPVMLHLNPEARFVVGIELTTSRIMGMVTGFNSEKLCRMSVIIDRFSDQEIVIEQIICLVNELIKKANIPRKKIIGLAISAPGPYDHEEGVLTNPPNFPKWKNVKLKEVLEDALKIQITIVKETVAAAFGEYWLGGVGRDKCLFAINSMNVGLGGGIIINGKIFHGFKYGAGDLGHMTIDINGPECTCGNYGCLESMVSENNMKNIIISHIKSGTESSLTDMVTNLEKISIKHIVQGAVSGDWLCKYAIEEVAKYLGIGISNIINILSPDIIVIGGELTIECPTYLEKAIEHVRKEKYPFYNKDVVIKSSSYGDEMCVIGAICIVLHEFFKNI